MTLEQFYYIGEIAGVIVVTVTLIFLTIQVRQNTKALRSAAAQNAHDMAEAIYHPVVTDAALADLVIRGIRDPDALTEVETARFTSFWQNGFFAMQNWFYQRQQGVLDEGIWVGWFNVLADITQTPGIRRFWAQRRHYFSDDFRTYVETEVSTREANPEYRPLGTSPISPASSQET